MTKSTKAIAEYPKKHWADKDPEKLANSIADICSEITDVDVEAVIFGAHMAGVVPVDGRKGDGGDLMDIHGPTIPASLVLGKAGYGIYLGFSSDYGLTVQGRLVTYSVTVHNPE